MVYFVPVPTADSQLRVVLVDDHHFFREGLRGMLAEAGIAIVGEASDGARVVRLVRELSPDVVVLDLKMPNVSGMEALRQIVAASPDTGIVVLTVSAEAGDAIEALVEGACAYLLKETNPEELIGGIRLVAAGHAVISRPVAQLLAARVSEHNAAVQEVGAEAGEPALTERELEVLRLIVAGADNATIGDELSISKHTVKQYVTNIFEKLGVSSRVEAAVYAVRNGIV